jgi:hypothetical protein
MADILTLAEFRVAQGTDPTDTRNDAQWTQWLSFVSAAIRSLTERDFGAPIVTEQRTFEYDGSGYLDIDDASAITAVTLSYPYSADIILSADEWTAKPTRRDDAPVFWYIAMPGYVGATAGSPEMGFERNLDVYARERAGLVTPSLVKVDATWGWPVIPGDVKMAAIWTMQEWISRPSGEGLTSEAIEGWSRSWAGRGGTSAAALAVPARALDILANYTKFD